MNGKILVVSDDPSARELLSEVLTGRGHEVVSETSEGAALERLATEDFDVLLGDLETGRTGGLELCERVKNLHPSTQVVVVTSQGSVGAAVAAMRHGAYDFVAKPIDRELLGACIDRALEHRCLSEEVRRLRGEVAAKRLRSGIFGTSRAMVRVLDVVNRASGTAAPVLIHGEAGTGKELVARAIHAGSVRSGRRFVAVSCAAIPAALLESELLGHVNGARADARTPGGGLFVEADGGTLFLDEVGELPLEVQAKLSRALHARAVPRAGDAAEVPFDVRLVAATHRDLDVEVREKRFHEDLRSRIEGVRVDVPPLRSRGADVLLLAQHFLNEAASRSGRPPHSISAAAARQLIGYAWPGNVRELANCMERVVALAPSDEIGLDDLPARVRALPPEHHAPVVDEPSDVVTVAELERRHLLRVLRLVEGNKSRAASMLGLDRRTLYRKLRRYGGRA